MESGVPPAQPYTLPIIASLLRIPVHYDHRSGSELRYRFALDSGILSLLPASSSRRLRERNVLAINGSSENGKIFGASFQKVQWW